MSAQIELLQDVAGNEPITEIVDALHLIDVEMSAHENNAVGTNQQSTMGIVQGDALGDSLSVLSSEVVKVEESHEAPREDWMQCCITATRRGPPPLGDPAFSSASDVQICGNRQSIGIKMDRSSLSSQDLFLPSSDILHLQKANFCRHAEVRPDGINIRAASPFSDTRTPRPSMLFGGNQNLNLKLDLGCASPVYDLQIFTDRSITLQPNANSPRLSSIATTPRSSYMGSALTSWNSAFGSQHVMPQLSTIQVENTLTTLSPPASTEVSMVSLAVDGYQMAATHNRGTSPEKSSPDSYIVGLPAATIANNVDESNGTNLTEIQHHSIEPNEARLANTAKLAQTRVARMAVLSQLAMHTLTSLHNDTSLAMPTSASIHNDMSIEQHSHRHVIVNAATCASASASHASHHTLGQNDTDGVRLSTTSSAPIERFTPARATRAAASAGTPPTGSVLLSSLPQRPEFQQKGALAQARWGIDTTPRSRRGPIRSFLEDGSRADVVASALTSLNVLNAPLTGEHKARQCLSSAQEWQAQAQARPASATNAAYSSPVYQRPVGDAATAGAVTPIDTPLDSTTRSLGPWGHAQIQRAASPFLHTPHRVRAAHGRNPSPVPNTTKPLRSNAWQWGQQPSPSQDDRRPHQHRPPPSPLYNQPPPLHQHLPPSPIAYHHRPPSPHKDPQAQRAPPSPLYSQPALVHQHLKASPLASFSQQSTHFTQARASPVQVRASPVHVPYRSASPHTFGAANYGSSLLRDTPSGYPSEHHTHTCAQKYASSTTKVTYQQSAVQNVYSPRGGGGTQLTADRSVGSSLHQLGGGGGGGIKIQHMQQQRAGGGVTIQQQQSDSMGHSDFALKNVDGFRRDPRRAQWM